MPYIIFLLLVLFLPSTSLASGTYLVARVIDGDTLKISYRGQKESIRLIGIDTPPHRKSL